MKDQRESTDRSMRASSSSRGTSQKFDVELADLGTIWTLFPLTAKARRWTRKNLAGATTYAGRIIIESGYVSDIFQGMQDAGLWVLVPVKAVQS